MRVGATKSQAPANSTSPNAMTICAAVYMFKVLSRRCSEMPAHRAS